MQLKIFFISSVFLLLTRCEICSAEISINNQRSRTNINKDNSNSPYKIPPTYKQNVKLFGSRGGNIGEYNEDENQNHLENNRFTKNEVRKRKRTNVVTPIYENDLTLEYTNSFIRKMLVSISTVTVKGISTFVLFNFLLKLISSKFPLMWMSALVACASIISNFTQGEISDFTNALGTLLILLVRRSKVHLFVNRFTQQLIAASFLSKRRAFPPSQDPWKYESFGPDDPLDRYSMTNALLGSILVSAYVGYHLAKRIPFFPGWIGAIGSFATVGYIGTFQDSCGDLIRYFGFSMNEFLSSVTGSMNEVYLREKTSVLLQNLFYFLKKIDDQFKIVKTVLLLWFAIVNYLKMIVNGNQKGKASSPSRNNAKNQGLNEEDASDFNRFGNKNEQNFPPNDHNNRYNRQFQPNSDYEY